MPSVPTYIRQSDYDKYEAIRIKGKGAWAKFVHDALNDTIQVSYASSVPRPMKSELAAIKTKGENK